MEQKDRAVHKQMGKKGAQNDTIWFQQKADMEPIPAHETGVGADDDKKR